MFHVEALNDHIKVEPFITLNTALVSQRALCPVKSGVWEQRWGCVTPQYRGNIYIKNQMFKNLKTDKNSLFLQKITAYNSQVIKHFCVFRRAVQSVENIEPWRGER